MPALSKQRKGALNGVQTKQAAAEARSQAFDPDYVDDPMVDAPTAPRIEEELGTGAKRKCLTVEQVRMCTINYTHAVR
jgi:hypothetical protein